MSTETYVVLGILAFFGLCWVFVQIISKPHPCPHCKATMRLPKFETPVPSQCENCGDYARLVNNIPSVVDGSYVANEPWFEFKLSQLKELESWSVPWTGRCCACGKEATKELNLEIERRGQTADYVIAREVLVQRFNFKFGCCGACKDPFDPPHITVGGNWTLKFRSYAFWSEFRKLNGR